MKMFLLTALKLGVESSRKGSKQPTKYTTNARWDSSILMEQPPTLKQYERIVEFLTLFMAGSMKKDRTSVFLTFKIS